jgi:hypothetical protein
MERMKRGGGLSAAAPLKPAYRQMEREAPRRKPERAAI